MSRTNSTPGPITWAAIIATTCVMLFLSQKMLWLVVPFLLALVLYYLLEPMAKRMVLAGISRNLAASGLSGAFLLFLIAVLLILYPIILPQVDQWQNTLAHYVNGGLSLLDTVVHGLEHQFGFIRNAHLSDNIHSSVDALQEHFAERYMGTVVLTVIEWLPSLLLIPIITFFLLKEGGSFRQFLGHAVPNAYFEKTLFLSHAVNHAARLYFVGLFKLALIDILMLTVGLFILGIHSGALMLGILVGLISQIPYVGPLIGCLVSLLVVGTDFPNALSMAYGVIILFVCIRLLDDFLFIPTVVGKSLRLHPLLSILMLFIGGTIAGISGLMLALPMLGIIMLLGETLEIIFTDQRLRARHLFALKLRKQSAESDLKAS
ncbi:MAG TPA: AI-2E family transporter [Methylophilaceae bacterium]|jgi:predicted PurR-regulated permease PerM